MTTPELFDRIQESLKGPPARVVSLVPSMTESLFDLGLGDALVGITDFCERPQHSVAALPRVGGTKNPRLADVLDLAPDLVLANQEENTPDLIHQLEEAGVRVWVTFPATIAGALAVLRQLAELWQAPQALVQVDMLERAVEWRRAALADQARVRYFCPIWADGTAGKDPWWMTFNHGTYIHDLLDLFGGENVFADRQRRYPLGADLGRQPAEDPAGRDTRYPRVSAAEIQEADPQLILLPDEPYTFDADYALVLSEYLPGVAAIRNGRILPVDGSLLSWHGTRLARALQHLPDLPTLVAGDDT